MAEEILSCPETVQIQDLLISARYQAFEVLNQAKENDVYESWRVLRKTSANSTVMRAENTLNNKHLFIDNIEHSGVLMHLVDRMIDVDDSSDIEVVDTSFLLGPTPETSYVLKSISHEYKRFGNRMPQPIHSVNDQLEAVKSRGTLLDEQFLLDLNVALTTLAGDTKQAINRQPKTGRVIGRFIGSKHVTH